MNAASIADALTLEASCFCCSPSWIFRMGRPDSSDQERQAVGRVTPLQPSFDKRINQVQSHVAALSENNSHISKQLRTSLNSWPKLRGNNGHCRLESYKNLHPWRATKTILSSLPPTTIAGPSLC